MRRPSLVRASSARILIASLIALLLLASGELAPAPVAAHPVLTDTIRADEWQLNFLRIKDAWQYSEGAGETVAVIDSGVDANHPDLAGQVLPGADFVDGSTDGRSDVVGHGTTVAALIAGKNDDNGVEGLAPKAKILPIRVLDPNNEYSSAQQVADAVRWAVNHNATVINMSLGSSEDSPILSSALHYAMDHDVVVVACNGNVSNDRGKKIWHPAREPGVIAVSGVSPDATFWNGSLQGSQTVLAAPATNIAGPNADGGYWNVQGTSFAAPMVAATAALVRSRFPMLDANNTINRLLRTAWDLGPAGRDKQYGFGVVNPTGAVSASLAPVDHDPLLANQNQAGGSGKVDIGPASPSLPGKAQGVTIHHRSRWMLGEVILLAVVAGVVAAAAMSFVSALSRKRRIVFVTPPNGAANNPSRANRTPGSPPPLSRSDLHQPPWPPPPP